MLFENRKPFAIIVVHVYDLMWTGKAALENKVIHKLNSTFQVLKIKHCSL